MKHILWWVRLGFGVLLLGLFALLIWGTVTSADAKESPHGYATPPVNEHSVSISVKMSATVPMGNWCDHEDNWESTLLHFNGDVEAMLAFQGFTIQSFTEYCSAQ